MLFEANGVETVGLATAAVAGISRKDLPRSPSSFDKNICIGIVHLETGEVLCSSGPIFSALEAERIADPGLEDAGLAVRLIPTVPAEGCEWSDEHGGWVQYSESPSSHRIGVIMAGEPRPDESEPASESKSAG